MDVIQLIEIVIPPIVSIAIVILGFRYSKSLASIEKNKDFKMDIKRALIEKTEELISSLYYLDYTIQDVFKNMADWIMITEESDELHLKHKKLQNGQEEYQIQLNKCKALICLYHKSHMDKLNEYIDLQVKCINDFSVIMLGSYNSKERVKNAEYIQMRNRALSLNLMELSESIIKDFHIELGQ